MQHNATLSRGCVCHTIAYKGGNPFAFPRLAARCPCNTDVAGAKVLQDVATVVETPAILIRQVAAHTT
jgi:hypothetical protein